MNKRARKASRGRKTLKILPTNDALVNPTLTVLRRRGGTASGKDIVAGLIKMLNVHPSVLQQMKSKTGTKLSYRAAWARNLLKLSGLVVPVPNSRGMWALTEEGRKPGRVNVRELHRRRLAVRETVQVPVRGEVVQPVA